MTYTVPMRDVLERYGVAVNRAGYALCPFHDEKTPSLKVYDKTNSYYCFGCGKGGDPVRFVRDLFGLSFRDACARLRSDRLLTGTAQAYKPPREENDRLFERYLDLVQKQEDLLFLRRHYAPARVDETLHEAFVYAVRELESVRFDILNFPMKEAGT